MVTAGDRATTRQAGRQGGSGGTVASDPTRRAILAATAALPLLAAGCNGVGALASPPRPGPDVALLRDAISAEELMVAGYQAAVSRLHVAGGSGAQARRAPGEAADLAVLVSSLLGQHQAHLSQLRMRLKVPAGSPYPSASERRGAPPPRLPAGPSSISAYLAHAERQAAARLSRQLLAAPPSLAQLLASISAAEASHVPPLTAHALGPLTPQGAG
jgi:hypothetical protein